MVKPRAAISWSGGKDCCTALMRMHRDYDIVAMITMLAEDGARTGVGRLVALALIAGAPAVLGAWIGGFLTKDLLAVLFSSLAAGIALQVVFEVGRFVVRRAPGGLTSGYALGGYLTGIVAMYATGLLVA